MVASETERVLATRGDLVIAETRHGFVCANAWGRRVQRGRGSLALLPDDPDASARSLRMRLGDLLDVADLAVVITDTFGRAWRTGVVNVAIGCAGLPAIVDLRGRVDDRGRTLEATVVALADEVASASGLVMAKDARVPVAIVRGVDRLDAPTGSAGEIVRPPGDDLFRSSPLQALHDRRTIRAFGLGEVSREAIEAAIEAACTAPAPHHTRPWQFTVLVSPVARRTTSVPWRKPGERTWAAMGPGRRDRTPSRGQRCRARERSGADRPLAHVRRGPHLRGRRAGGRGAEMFLLSGGAAIQNLLLGASAQGLASCWISSSIFCREEARAALGMDDRWHALGTVACGPMPEAGPAGPRPPIDVGDIASGRDASHGPGVG